jgi:hypothetical protein
VTRHSAYLRQCWAIVFSIADIEAARNHLHRSPNEDAAEHAIARELPPTSDLFA